MEGRELLDAHVFNRRQEIEDCYKPFFSVDFLDCCFFSLLHIYLELKRTPCLTSICRKNDSQFDRKKET